ncbi:MAG TPA: hypothetical protein VFP93_04410, partial [Gammaproteobacteria bacterium]|nr:hypothetical protein [Gammaproteobacteria bacterium]
LCKRIMLSSNQKVAMTVVKVIAPVLKNGLELHNGLEFDNGLEYANGFDNFENSLSKNDFINQFFEEFTLCCLEDPIFEFPFSEIIDKCFNYPTFKGSYTEIMEKHQFDSTLKLPILPREIIDKYKSNHENSALNTIKTDYVQKLWAPKKIDWSIIPTPKRNKPIRENSTTPNEINKETVQPNLAIAQSTSKPSETKFARTRGNTHNEKMRKFVPQKNDSGIINTEPLSDPYTESSLSSDSITQSDSMEQDVNINEKIIALLGIDYFQECSDMQSKKRRRQTDRKRHRPHSWNNADKTPLAQNNGNNEVKGAVAESNCELKKPSLLNAFQNLRLKRNHETKMHKRGMSNN